MEKKPYYITAAELALVDKEHIPSELISNRHFIYSSPATLSFNSPGAEGFGVKRAGLAIPDSVMLLVAPGCCGRNTSALSVKGEERERFFYLMLDETDIVTGRHLMKVPKAVQEVCNYLEKRPSVVMICITCVDALLGTDMERVCKKAEKLVGIPVRPCYMYALTREGRKPPMVHVRQSLYSLLEPAKRRAKTINLLGYFAPVHDESELYDILQNMGFDTINEISRCADYEEYLKMAEANFNLVLNNEASYAAADLTKRLNQPYIEFPRLYHIQKIHKQYQALAGALQKKIDDTKYYERARREVEDFVKDYSNLHIAIGGTLNANAYELASAFLDYGIAVDEIYANLATEDLLYVKKIAKKSPETKIYSNLEPTMLYYDCSDASLDLTIGRDAAYYHPDCPNVAWNTDRQPFGYESLITLLQTMRSKLSDGEE